MILSLALNAKAQVAFKTIVPQQSVVVGESFQVQFTIGDDEEITNLKPPAFNHFRIVTGPHIYYGSVATTHGIKPLKNTVYTLVAPRAGRFIIPGATAVSYGEIIQSNDVLIEVISKEEAVKRFNSETGRNNSGFFLKPGEDAYEKIKQNLFLKVMVDRKTCYVGEPVLATFKLYSRLESRSDIVKNPGFYGFTVYDMVNLSDRLVTSENVNGKAFDVHTIRKVQLYPLQAGDFMIDPMEVRNKVEFTRSAINKKTEQEIVEGVLGFDEDEEKIADGTETFETDMHTTPIVIRVKPTPEKERPPEFTGAVGAFTVRGTVLQEELGKNEQGIFEVVISGKGNFTQLDAPVVKWPAGMEGFAPEVKDMFDRSAIPLTGQRVYRFVFVASNPGKYNIPGISFSFYNPDSGRYKNIITQPVKVIVTSRAKRTGPGIVTEAKDSKSRINTTGIITCIILLAGLAGLFVFLRNRKKLPPPSENPVSQIPTVDMLLASTHSLVPGDDKEFYRVLHQSVWDYFKNRLHLSGSELSRNGLLARLQLAGINKENVDEVMEILRTCESGIFTDAQLPDDKMALFKQTKDVLDKLDRSLL